MLVDAVYGEAVELVERTHPLGVTLGEVVVHGNYVYAIACEGVEEYGQRSHEGLTLTGSHLGNLALVQYHTTEKLHVVVHHVPDGLVATCLPVILVDGLVALDAHEILRGSQCTVHVGGGHGDLLVLGEELGGSLHDGKGFGQHLVKRLLVLVEYGGLELVDLVEELFALLDLGLLDLGLQLGDPVVLAGSRVLDALLQLLRLGAELVGGE